MDGAIEPLNLMFEASHAALIIGSARSAMAVIACLPTHIEVHDQADSDQDPVRAPGFTHDFHYRHLPRVKQLSPLPSPFPLLPSFKFPIPTSLAEPPSSFYDSPQIEYLNVTHLTPKPYTAPKSKGKPLTVLSNTTTPRCQK